MSNTTTQRLMPMSLAEFINKKSKDLVPLSECYSRFSDAVSACKMHSDAFGFIPDEWTLFITQVQACIDTGNNTTGEQYVRTLISTQVRRLAWITRIAASNSEYEQEDLLAISMDELEEVLEETFPSDTRMDIGSFGRGFNKNAA